MISEKESLSPSMASPTYLEKELTSFLSIWGTIVWIFVAGHFVIHVFLFWYAWRVVNSDKAKVAWYWPALASLFSVVIGFITVAIIALPVAGIFISISLPIPVWVAALLAGVLLLVYVALNFNGLYIF